MQKSGYEGSQFSLAAGSEGTSAGKADRLALGYLGLQYSGPLLEDDLPGIAAGACPRPDPSQKHQHPESIIERLGGGDKLEGGGEPGNVKCCRLDGNDDHLDRPGRAHGDLRVTGQGINHRRVQHCRRPSRTEIRLTSRPKGSLVPAEIAGRLPGTFGRAVRAVQASRRVWRNGGCGPRDGSWLSYQELIAG